MTLAGSAAVNAGRAGWVAAQVGHRVGALALLATCGGVALMVGGKRAFVPALACGCAAGAVGVVSSLLARRWGERGVWGLVVFNVVVMVIAVAAMVLGRTGWGGIVGMFASGGKL